MKVRIKSTGEIKKESKEQLKAKLTNEIAKRFSERIKRLEERNKVLASQLSFAQKTNFELSDKVSQLECKLREYEEWNERLQDFAYMSEEDRIEFLRNENQKYMTGLKMDRMLSFYNSVFDKMFR